MVKPFGILMNQDMTVWQWNQLDHIQIILFAPRSRQITISAPQHLIFLGTGCFFWMSCKQHKW